MGNIVTESESNPVTAHEIFNSIGADSGKEILAIK
jgi:hypothetical protein